MDTLRWQAGTLFLLDQTKLPFEEIYLPCHSWQDVRQAISVLAVRGAPAIGVAAAYAVVLAARTLCQKGGDTPFLTDLETICRDLDAARLNTAVSGTAVTVSCCGDSTFMLIVQDIPGAISYLFSSNGSSVSATEIPVACVELFIYSLSRAGNGVFW